MKRFLVVFALVLVVGALLASTVLAAPPAPNGRTALGSWMSSRAGIIRGAAQTPAPGEMMNGGMVGGIMMHDDLEKLLGISHTEIHNQMIAGQSLVEIAAAKGVDKDQLTKALLDGRRASLDQQVQDGRLTQEQATTMLQYMEQNLETMVTAQGVNGMMQGMGGMMGGMGNGANSGACPMHNDQPSQSSEQTSGAGVSQNGLQQA